MTLTYALLGIPGTLDEALEMASQQGVPVVNITAKSPIGMNYCEARVRVKGFSVPLSRHPFGDDTMGIVVAHAQAYQDALSAAKKTAEKGLRPFINGSSIDDAFYFLNDCLHQLRTR